MLSHSEYLSLIETLKKAADAYYNLSTPVMTDHDYDKLYRQCQEFETQNPLLKAIDSPTNTVGSAPKEGTKKYNIPRECHPFKTYFHPMI